MGESYFYIVIDGVPQEPHFSKGSTARKVVGWLKRNYPEFNVSLSESRLPLKTQPKLADLLIEFAVGLL